MIYFLWRKDEMLSTLDEIFKKKPDEISLKNLDEIFPLKTWIWSFKTWMRYFSFTNTDEIFFLKTYMRYFFWKILMKYFSLKTPMRYFLTFDNEMRYAFLKTWMRYFTKNLDEIFLLLLSQVSPLHNVTLNCHLSKITSSSSLSVMTI